MEAGESFLNEPMERPFIASWSRVQSAVPSILTRVRDAVNADNAE
jgi:glucosyl-3-phosphoglycerate synthase